MGHVSNHEAGCACMRTQGSSCLLFDVSRSYSRIVSVIEVCKLDPCYSLLYDTLLCDTHMLMICMFGRTDTDAWQEKSSPILLCGWEISTPWHCLARTDGRIWRRSHKKEFINRSKTSLHSAIHSWRCFSPRIFSALFGFFFIWPTAPLQSLQDICDGIPFLFARTILAFTV